MTFFFILNQKEKKYVTEKKTYSNILACHSYYYINRTLEREIYNCRRKKWTKYININVLWCDDDDVKLMFV